MVSSASDLLATEGASSLDWASVQILQFIQKLETTGLLDPQVNLNAVGAVTFGILLAIRFTFKKYRGVDWYALIHAIITGYGSLFAAYLDAHAAEPLTGLAEPLRSCSCHGSLTSLHRVLPAITMGYATFDLLDGLTLGIDFALHGFFTLLVMVVFVQMNAPHVVAPFLLMEVSTINLAMMRADFFPELVALANMAGFAFFFFLFRIVVCPILWWQLCQVMWAERNSETYQSCFPPALLPFFVLAGVFFNALNSFWFYKIVRKIQRKLSGDEDIKAENHLTEADKAMDEQEKKEK